MTILEEPLMGRFSVEVELSNHEDLFRAKAGLIAPDQVRRARVRGVVDSGATRLVIPLLVAQQLQLREPRECPRSGTPTAHRRSVHCQGFTSCIRRSRKCL